MCVWVRVVVLELYSIGRLMILVILTCVVYVAMYLSGWCIYVCESRILYKSSGFCVIGSDGSVVCVRPSFLTFVS